MRASEFIQLNTADSWRSPYSVIVHIDLDAFYSQCQAVTMHLDPTKPLASRQWHSVIAVNYPARDFKIKRGMSVKECRELCPEIQLPHVPTYKKGSTSWRIEKEPRVETHKVALDLFRGESRKIFKIFRSHFKKVEKAGIDEGFVDLGPEVYSRALELYPQLKQYLEQSDNTGIPILKENEDTETSWHDILLKIGSELVHSTRMQIYEELKYTCSAGIAPNKLLAKLGSGYKKPFKQTLILPDNVASFLDEHKFTDLWGWGGKRGQAILQALGVEDVPSQISLVGLNGIVSKLDDMEKARHVFECANGTSRSEVKPRTVIKSMASVKNFTNSPLNTMEDLREWLIVYCSDLTGRLDDMTDDDPEKMIFRPQTIAIRYHGGVTKTNFSKQQPCSLPYHKSPLEALSTAVNELLPTEKRVLPCVHFTIELSNIHGIKPTSFFTVKALDPNENAGNGGNDLFVPEPSQFCKKCNKHIPTHEEDEHKDWHLAKQLQHQINTSPKKPSSDTNSPKRSAVQKRPKSASKQQPTLLKFFDKHK